MLPRLRVSASSSGAKPPTIPEEGETQIVGSETGTLRDPLDFNHAAVVFADALFRRLPLDLDVAAFDHGREDAATSAMARRLGTKIRRHPRLIIDILRKRLYEGNGVLRNDADLDRIWSTRNDEQR
ncbi:uncharacterized protein PG998_008156 [Apiospora kogelbergensis]|uniref:uncharacterized protein n=1 Tax=Apiospora kogelbergensis TaxID=1337665 RepID=UPI003130A2CB